MASADGWRGGGADSVVIPLVAVRYGYFHVRGTRRAIGVALACEGYPTFRRLRRPRGRLCRRP